MHQLFKQKFQIIKCQGEQSKCRVQHDVSQPPLTTMQKKKMYGMILTEYLLNTGRRPQTSERAIKYLHNQEGQKQKEGEKDQNGTCAPGRELYKRKGSSTL